MCDYAAPATPAGRLGHLLAHLPERAAGAGHHRLFADYLSRGASEGLLGRHGEAFARIGWFLFGAVGLYRVGEAIPLPPPRAARP